MKLTEKYLLESINTYQLYSNRLKREFNIDLSKFNQTLHGGLGDNKIITDFDLEQLIQGIKIEKEHTSDAYQSLEIAMDHLSELPDYYTRLIDMENNAEQLEGE